MAKYGVFGCPITEGTVRKMPEYHNKSVITRADMARVARNLKNIDLKEDDCKRFVQNLQKEYGGKISTLCMVYNATGGDLSLSLYHDWNGQVYDDQYPPKIRNGQWAGWLHVPRNGSCDGSCGMVAFLGENNVGTSKQWIHCWEITGKPHATNKVFAECRATGHYDYVKPASGWSNLHRYLKLGYFNDECDGCTSEAIIDSGNNAIYKAIMSLV